MSSLLKFVPFRRTQSDDSDAVSGSPVVEDKLEKERKGSYDDVDAVDPDSNPSPGALSLEEGALVPRSWC